MLLLLYSNTITFSVFIILTIIAKKYMYLCIHIYK